MSILSHLSNIFSGLDDFKKLSISLETGNKIIKAKIKQEENPETVKKTKKKKEVLAKLEEIENKFASEIKSVMQDL